MFNVNCGKTENVDVKYDINVLDGERKIFGNEVTWLLMVLLSSISSSPHIQVHCFKNIQP